MGMMECFAWEGDTVGSRATLWTQVSWLNPCHHFYTKPTMHFKNLPLIWHSFCKLVAGSTNTSKTIERRDWLKGQWSTLWLVASRAGRDPLILPQFQSPNLNVLNWTTPYTLDENLYATLRMKPLPLVTQAHLLEWCWGFINNKNLDEKKYMFEKLGLCPMKPHS